MNMRRVSQWDFSGHDVIALCESVSTYTDPVAVAVEVVVTDDVANVAVVDEQFAASASR
jgi:hypothetical protein